MRVILMVYMNRSIVENTNCGSNYIKLPKELDHSKRLIDIQDVNNANQSFTWCLVRYGQIIIQHKLGKLTIILRKILILKTRLFLPELEIF